MEIDRRGIVHNAEIIRERTIVFQTVHVHRESKISTSRSDVTACPWKERQRERNPFQDMLFHGDIVLVQVSLLIAVESPESAAKMVILEPLSE